MTRRLLLLVPLSLTAQIRDTPRNRLGLAANAFNAQYAKWADQMNAKPETLNVGAVEAWQPLSNLWRKVERLWTEWLRG